MAISYMMEFFGDLPTKGLLGPKVFNTLEEGLRFLEDTFPLVSWKDHSFHPQSIHPHLGHNKDNQRLWLDPEDDRIIIWRIETGSSPNVQVCWHFSGWHWNENANDLSGGPLDQGCLPRDGDTSLYALACRD